MTGYKKYRQMAQDTNTPLGEVLRVYDAVLYYIGTAQLLGRLDDRMEMVEHAKDGVTKLLLALDLSQGEIAESLAAIYKYILKLLGTDFIDATEENKQIRLQESYNLLNTLLSGWRYHA